MQNTRFSTKVNLSAVEHPLRIFTLSDTENDICSEINEMTKTSQWHQWQGLGAVWSALHTTVEPIIIIVILRCRYRSQCELTITPIYYSQQLRFCGHKFACFDVIFICDSLIFFYQKLKRFVALERRLCTVGIHYTEYRLQRVRLQRVDFFLLYGNFCHWHQCYKSLVITSTLYNELNSVNVTARNKWDPV